MEELLGTLTQVPNTPFYQTGDETPAAGENSEALGEQCITQSEPIQIEPLALEDPTVTETPPLAETPGDLTEKQVVVFRLASVLYGLDIECVREIIRVQDIFKLPGAPVFVEGVINLRGKVVPVVDLRKKLNIEEAEQTNESRIVIVDITKGQIGIIVDAVNEVLLIPGSLIEPSSFFTGDGGSDYINGVATIGDKLIILIDLSEMFS